MGNRHVAHLRPPSQDFEYCSIIFYLPNIIRVVPGHNEELIGATRHAIVRHWPSQIQRESHGDKSDQSINYDFRLSGSPFKTSRLTFLSNATNHALIIPSLACQILLNLYSIGWKLISSSDLTQKTRNPTWIFKFNPDLNRGKNLNVCCFNINSATNTIQIINTTNQLSEAVLAACQIVYQFDNESSSTTIAEESGNFIIKLDKALLPEDPEHAEIRKKFLILEVIKQLINIGYQLYGSCNLKSVADSLFFISNVTDNDSVYVSAYNYMAISLDKSSHINFLGYNDEALSIAREVIKRDWPIKSTIEVEKYGSWQFELGGRPWSPVEGNNQIQMQFYSRVLAMRLLQSLESIGWGVLQSIDLSRSKSDKTMFIMQSCTPANKEYICIAPIGPQNLNVIGLTLKNQEEVELIDFLFRQVIKQSYPKRVQKPLHMDYKNGVETFDFQFSGKLWSSGRDRRVTHSRNMMIHLIKALEDLDWSLVTSCDTSARYAADRQGNHKYPLDVHSLIFSRPI